MNDVEDEMKAVETDTFTAGYDRGREDGINQCIAFVGLAMDWHPQELPMSARGLLPGRLAEEINARIKAFGEHCYRAGAKDQKAKASKTAMLTSG
jgi:hypothetical protein